MVVSNSSFVAMFHVINDPNWFEDIIKFLKRSFDLIDADQLINFLSQRKFNSSFCHLSFDDGHRSFYDVVMPVLKKYRIPATLFISPKIIKDHGIYWFQILKQLPQADFIEYLIEKLNEDYSIRGLQTVSNVAIMKNLQFSRISDLLESYCRIKGIELQKNINLDLRQLREIVDSGLIEIGAHTMNHPILANENYEIANKEISKSIQLTGELTQKPVRLFACPNGTPGLDFGEREISIMRKNGIIMNFSTKADHLSRKYGFFSIPRIGITRGSHLFIALKIKYPRLWSYIRDHLNSNSELNQRNKVNAAKL